MAHSIPPSQSAPAAARDPASGQTGGADPIGAALGRIPSGLFVVTWREGDRDHGMLASWVMQAGFAPPAVSVAIAPGRDLLAVIDRGATFAINVLGEGQRPLLSRFGRPATAGEDPFDGLEHSRTPAGDLILQGSAAWLACRPLGRLEVTDHVIMLARIDTAGPGSVADPLVHVRKNGLRY